MNRADIIQRIIERIDAKTYLEIGVQRGKNFYKINARSKYAVDPEFKIGLKRKFNHLTQIFSNHFYEKTSDDFFSTDARSIFQTKKLDVCLIDGLHTYMQSLKDFENALKYLSPRGVILFHDCNPASKESADPDVTSPEEMKEKYPGKKAEWNGDVYKTIVHIRSFYPEYETVVLDCDYGVGVVWKQKPERKLTYSLDEIKKMTYSDLEKNRTALLNLKEPEYLNEIIRKL